MPDPTRHHRPFPSRRAFLSGAGMGFAGLVLGEMLHRDGIALGATDPAASPGLSHFAPKAKRVIWLFFVGGVSHLESFDPKPAVTKYAGRSIGDTPHKAILDSPYIKDNLRIAIQNDANGHIRPTLYPLQIGYKK